LGFYVAGALALCAVLCVAIKAIPRLVFFVFFFWATHPSLRVAVSPSPLRVNLMIITLWPTLTPDP